MYILPIAFLAVALIVFPVPKQGGFVSDDWDWLSAAARHTSIFPDLLANSTGTHAGGSYNPLSSLWINVLHRSFRMNAASYHIASIILHSLNAFLLALLAMLILRVFFLEKRAWKFGTGAGLLFVLWPTHVEAVQWIAAVPHMLATFFVLLTLYAYILFRVDKSRFASWLVLFSSLCAFCSKETALMLPLLLLGIELWYQRHHLKTIKLGEYRFVIGVFLVAIIFLVMRFVATGIVLGDYAEQQLVIRPLQWINTLLTFFEEFLTLGTARVPWMQWYWQHPVLIGCSGLVVFAGIWWCIWRLRKEGLLLWWHLLLISLVPFITLGFNRLSQEGERYTYLPSAFFIIFVTILVYLYARRFAYLLFVLMFCATVQPLVIRNQAWQQAFRVAHDIVIAASSLPQLSDPSHLYLFVGLPDTIGGAQVFRNNLAEAVLFSAPEHAAQVIELPIYTQFRSSEANASVLRWTSDSRGLFARNPDHRLVVTGFDRRETEYLTYELWDYNYSFFSSDTIRLLFADSLKQAISSGKASIMTWNAGSLLEVTHSPAETSSL